MSGVCGLFNLDKVRVSRPELAGMAAMLEARAPDRTGLWQDGPVGLGHTLLASTPESRFETLPLRDAESGCVITADIRLDNREELLTALGLKRRRFLIGDAGIVLAAYLYWGEACTDRLLGDFAFAIYDPRAQKIFAARDPFGLRPYYYFHDPARLFAFASSAHAILTLPQIPYRLNEGRIADFLVPQLEWIDYTSTFFEDIYRLPPGHRLTVSPDRFDISEFWSPQPGSDPGPRSDDEWREGFLEVFTAAVEARLRAPSNKVGSMLSGGLDSGSVVAVAKSLLDARGEGPLPTYSAIRPDSKDCAESEAIRAAKAMSGIAPRLVYPPFRDDAADTSLSRFDEPYDGELMILDAIYQAAHQDGRSVILDGAGGDIVLSEGTYISRLLRKGRIPRAVTEVIGQGRFWNSPRIGRELLRYLASAYLPASIKRGVRPFRQRRIEKDFIKDSLISPELFDRVDVNARFERMRELFPGEWTLNYATERLRAVRPNACAGRERYGRLAARFGIEARDPFLDMRVVRYCAHLPGGLRLRDGWPKIMLREMMAGRLPDEVRWMRGKPHLGPVFNEASTKVAFEAGRLDLSELQRALDGYVDPRRLEIAWQAFRNGRDAARVHSVGLLATWLDENKNRPVVPLSELGYSMRSS